MRQTLQGKQRSSYSTAAGHIGLKHTNSTSSMMGCFTFSGQVPDRFQIGLIRFLIGSRQPPDRFHTGARQAYARCSLMHRATADPSVLRVVKTQDRHGFMVEELLMLS